MPSRSSASTGSSSESTSALGRLLRRIGRTLALLTLLGALVLGLASGYAARWAYGPISGLDAPREAQIRPGHFKRTADDLRQADLIAHPRLFRLLARAKGLDGAVKAGIYTVTPGTSPVELLELITTAGRATQLRLTLPEGKTRFHAADRVAALKLADRDAFLKATADRAVLTRAKLPGSVATAEGYLFPDTYFLRPDMRPAQLVQRLIRRHRVVWREVRSEAKLATFNTLNAKLQLSRHELVTLASMIEAEAAVAEERPIIARVFYNRLKKKMKLQSDPTCTYGPDTYDQKATPALCRDPKSTTSTYVIKGLPPTPIANPGRDAIRAVFEPSDAPEHRDLLYFVADPSRPGHHVFSATYEDHLKGVKALREAAKKR